MSGYEFMAQHPFLTSFLAVVIGSTIMSIFDNITKIWRNSDEQKNQEEES
ncbi:hypothetical protein ACVR1I_06565 [Streptococcus cameli]